MLPSVRWLSGMKIRMEFQAKSTHKRKIVFDITGDFEMVERIHTDIIHRMGQLNWEPSNKH